MAQPRTRSDVLNALTRARRAAEEHMTDSDLCGDTWHENTVSDIVRVKGLSNERLWLVVGGDVE